VPSVWQKECSRDDRIDWWFKADEIRSGISKGADAPDNTIKLTVIKHVGCALGRDGRDRHLHPGAPVHLAQCKPKCLIVDCASVAHQTDRLRQEWTREQQQCAYQCSDNPHDATFSYINH
ncbi:MAG: hypothetical protein AB3N22_19135, partial [Ruegeria sp.]